MFNLGTSHLEKDERDIVEKLKIEWKQMWTTKFNDKTRAEGVSAENYSFLKVSRGTVIHATRNYKTLDLREILEQNRVKDTDRFILPHKEVGGWHKFAKTQIIPNTPRSQRLAAKHLQENTERNSRQQLKKGGRGWLHTTK